MIGYKNVGADNEYLKIHALCNLTFNRQGQNTSVQILPAFKITNRS